MKVPLMIPLADEPMPPSVRQTLAESGYEVASCQRVLDCLAKLSRSIPYVMVLDRELPAQEVELLLAKMKAQYEGPGVPILFAGSDAPAETIPLSGQRADSIQGDHR